MVRLLSAVFDLRRNGSIDEAHGVDRDECRRLHDCAACEAGDAARALEHLAAHYPMMVASLNGADVRHRRGMFYTPSEVVGHLLDVALEPMLEESTSLHAGPISVCDPACGVGAFLAEAARRITKRLVSGGKAFDEARRIAVIDCVRGIDVEPVAAALCRLVLADIGGCAPNGISITVGNALVGSDPEPWREELPRMTYRVREGDQRSALRFALRRERSDCVPVPSQAHDDASARRAEEAWMAAVLRPPIRSDDDVIVTSGDLRRLAGGARDPMIERVIAERAEDHRWVHWHRAFAAPEGRTVRRLFAGNPPFLSRLARSTAASPVLSALLRTQTGGTVTRYVDLAAAFLALAARRGREGDRIAFVLPPSILSGRDGSALRADLFTRCRLRHVWLSHERAFGCDIRPCAWVLDCGAHAECARQGIGRSIGHAPVRTLSNHPGAEGGPIEELAAGVAASMEGVPMVRMKSRGTIGERARVTADFRDQYYGLREAIVEDCSIVAADEHFFPRLVTTGLIDPAACRWGVKPVRMFGRSWSAPRVDRSVLDRDAAMRLWASQRCVPKVLLATQTKVIEVWVDETGRVLPSVPLITIVPERFEESSLIAAALTAPPVCAEAIRRSYGLARDARGLRLSARQVAEIPLPSDEGAWQAAADAFRRAQGASDDVVRREALIECAVAGTSAYGLRDAAGSDVVDWWRTRLTGRGGPTGSQGEPSIATNARK